MIDPTHWTERDQQAWQLVNKRAQAAPGLDSAKFLDINFYVEQARDMAGELAAFYNPRAKDPVGALTIPEILSVIELAAQDMYQLIDQYIPGGHLLTVNDLRLARRATGWYQSGMNLYWLIAALFNPVDVGIRYVASRLGMSQAFQMLQKDLLVWFYTAYLNRLGTYLVELNSGRLRVGAVRYRELVRGQTISPSLQPVSGGGTTPIAAVDQVPQVTITLIGQVKAGKSSLVNALLGEQRARTDVLAATSEVTRYQLQPPGIATQLILLDTQGYAHIGPREDHVRITLEAAQQSDLLLLVLHARNPARQADVTLLQKLHAWFVERPDLKRPPILAVLTHIDLLSPAMEWSPPYNWQQPQSPKEQQISRAMAVTREQLGEFLVGVVPVCTAIDRVFGINEWLLPVVLNLLDEAHGVGLLRCLRAEFEADKIRKVFSQLLAAGKESGKILWRTLMKEDG
jgi:predicted GTPase